MPCFFKKMGWQSLLHGKMNLNIQQSTICSGASLVAPRWVGCPGTSRGAASRTSPPVSWGSGPHHSTARSELASSPSLTVGSFDCSADMESVNSFTRAYFHQHGPLGQVGLVVTKSVCLSVCLLSPSHAIFCVVGLVQSVPRPRTGAILISISISSRALKTRMCSGVRSWSRVEP